MEAGVGLELKLSIYSLKLFFGHPPPFFFKDMPCQAVYEKPGTHKPEDVISEALWLVDWSGF